MLHRVDRSFDAWIHRYQFPSPIQIQQEESGMNNTTRMIYAGDHRYVLRVYENHRDPEIVGIEHAILTRLQDARLSFQVPCPVRNDAGTTVTPGPDGKLAAVFSFIGGERPSIGVPAHIESLGRAAGELTVALAGLDVASGLQPLYKPYYAFRETHAAMTEAAIRALCASSPLLARETDKVERLLLVKQQLTSLIDPIKQLQHQWIHGDIVMTNALAEGDAIVGLLDFEFCAVDVRAMELAVLLAEFPDEDDALALERMALLCRGYGLKQSLMDAEILLLPDLIQLRMMDVWLHFAGRLAEGLDPESVWLRQIERVSFVCDWIQRQREPLYDVLAYLQERQPH